MKTIKTTQVISFLKNNKNAKVVYSDNLSGDKNKINQILKSADRIILISEEIVI